MLLKHEAVFQEPPHILWPPFSPTRHGREINKEQAVRGKMGGSGEREWESWKIEENNLCGKLLFSLRICKCSSSRETRDEQHFYNRISPGFTRGKGEFTCNAWHLLQHQALEQCYKVLFIATKRRDKKLLPTNWVFIYLLSKLLQKTVYDIFILLILCRAVFVMAKEHPEYSKMPSFKHLRRKVRDTLLHCHFVPHMRKRQFCSHHSS